MKKLNVEGLGQVFTKNHTIDILLSLRKNKTNLVLEPSCGDGAISNKLQNCVSIEIDNKVAPDYAINIDFFDYSIDNKFDTIIGNPPFVKYNDIFSSTKNKLEKYGSVFDKRTNLYISFIYKCIEHLTKNGELIFIVPREFLKATSSINVNNFLFENGTITDFIDMGDCKLFGDFTPNCIIFRFEKGNFSYKTKYQTAKINDNKILLSKIENRTFKNMNGQLVF